MSDDGRFDGLMNAAINLSSELIDHEHDYPGGRAEHRAAFDAANRIRVAVSNAVIDSYKEKA